MRNTTLRVTALLIVSVVFNLSQAQAQEASGETDETLKPTTGYWGVTFNVSGLINNIGLTSVSDINNNESILLRHYLKDDVALRVGFGLSSTNKKFTTVDSIGSAKLETDSTFKKTDFYLAPAIEQHFLQSKRLDPYIGAGLSFGVLGKNKSNSNRVTTDTTGIARLDIDSIIDGGFAFGANIMLGFNYFVSDKFSLGAEYVWGYRTISTGGDYSTVIIDTPITGTATTTRNVGSSRFSDSGFQMNSSASITLSYFFTRDKSKKSRTKTESS